jgi:hypothetical protein
VSAGAAPRHVRPVGHPADHVRGPWRSALVRLLPPHVACRWVHEGRFLSTEPAFGSLICTACGSRFTDLYDAGQLCLEPEERVLSEACLQRWLGRSDGSPVGRPWQSAAYRVARGVRLLVASHTDVTGRRMPDPCGAEIVRTGQLVDAPAR